MRDTPRPRNDVYALAAEVPPSTVSTEPVVVADVAKYSAASATSSGVPSRGSGRSLRILALVRSMNFSMASGGRPLTEDARIGVGIPPGAMQFTLIPSGASSVATLLLKWMTAALDAR